MKTIIKAFATKMSNPSYFETDDAQGTINYLEDIGYRNIEVREIRIHDKQAEGILKRCSLGSKMEQSYLRYIFNIQQE